MENAFANGTRGYVVRWSPDPNESDLAKNGRGGKAARVSAMHTGLSIRFVHEHAMNTTQTDWLYGIDYIDLEPRSEMVPKTRGKPHMIQLQVQPCAALTIHKVQALTLRETVRGCLEGLFSHGQLYVLWSRVTDPANFAATAVP